MHLPRTGKDDERNLSITKNADLFSLLDDTTSSLGVSHLPVAGVFNPLDLNLASPHGNNFFTFLFLLVAK